MSRKVIVRLKGGLGNQLFCYAAARRLARFNNAELLLDTVTGFKYDHSYRRTYALESFQLPVRRASPSEQMEPFGRLRRLAARKLSQGKPLERRRYIQQSGLAFDPDILNLRLQNDTTYFDPFGQSERYFSDIIDLLLQDLAMAAPSDDDNQRIARQIEAGPSLAIHMRWFEPADVSNPSNMSWSYYEEALHHLRARIGKVHAFLFSDQPEQAEALFKPLFNGQDLTVIRHNAASNNALADFWLMRQCQHFIIGNSTYAWWAAWLREQSHKGTQIVAPAQKIDPARNVTAWGFPGLLPERWTVL